MFEEVIQFEARVLHCFPHATRTWRPKIHFQCHDRDIFCLPIDQMRPNTDQHHNIYMDQNFRMVPTQFLSNFSLLDFDSVKTK